MALPLISSIGGQIVFGGGELFYTSIRHAVTEIDESTDMCAADTSTRASGNAPSCVDPEDVTTCACAEGFVAPRHPADQLARKFRLTIFGF